MRQIKTIALQNFPNFSDGNFVYFSTRVITRLTGNPNFPAAQQYAVSMVPALKDFNQKLSACSNGDRELIAAKQKSRVFLEELHRKAVREVNYAANFDKEILLSSGYDITADPKKKAEPATAADLKVA